MVYTTFQAKSLSNTRKLAVSSCIHRPLLRFDSAEPGCTENHRAGGGLLKKILIASALLIALIALISLGSYRYFPDEEQRGEEAVREEKAPEYREIAGNVLAGENLFDIFKKHGLDAKELFLMKQASASLHRLRDLYPGRPYKIRLDHDNRVSSFFYQIHDDAILRIVKTDEGFCAERTVVQYEKRMEYVGGTIKDNLVSSMGNGRDGLLLALALSDIFAWDIDFTTDVRNDDTYRIAAEGLYLDGEFKKYGNIVAAEFVNSGRTFRAYRYEIDGKADFYNEEGKSLRKAFLKAPLSFRRISSTFSRRRKHPILKIYRPHHGLDYVAPAGTPVSAAGDGEVAFAGRRGHYGKLVIVKHRNGYETYYGHLSRMAKNIRRGRSVEQGQLIGYVGATGLATGPHLHYEMRIHGKPVNPLSVAIPRGKAVPEKWMADFMRIRNETNESFASSRFGSLASAENDAAACSE